MLLGHWTHPAGVTGCTAVLVPASATGGVEVRGGGPGTRETDVLAPSSGARDVHGVLLTGGSAFGLAAAGGVVDWLEDGGFGHLTRVGLRVPLVPAAVVFDPGALDRSTRPTAEHGRAACEAAAGGTIEADRRGRVGVGTGTAAGKLVDPSGWTPTGFGAASAHAGDALVTALAVANPIGEVIAADGTVLAGSVRDGAFVRTRDLLAAGVTRRPLGRDATVLVVVTTDARIDRRGAWLLARSASAGVARAVEPVATTFDGDVAFCLATGQVDADPFALEAVAAHVAAEAVRDAALSARP